MMIDVTKEWQGLQKFHLLCDWRLEGGHKQQQVEVQISYFSRIWHIFHVGEVDTERGVLSAPTVPRTVAD